MTDLEKMADLLGIALSLMDSTKSKLLDQEKTRLRAEADALLENARYIEGQLYIQPNKRWLLVPNGNHELTSGDGLDLWNGDGWESTRIEHSHAEGGYYAVNGIPLRDGMHARIRRLR